MGECKYRLPCGHCDRLNKKCEIIEQITISTKNTLRRCGYCLFAYSPGFTTNALGNITDRVVCQITGKDRGSDDICDCEDAYELKSKEYFNL